MQAALTHVRFASVNLDAPQRAKRGRASSVPGSVTRHFLLLGFVSFVQARSATAVIRDSVAANSAA
jgi:hypothetical protein